MKRKKIIFNYTNFRNNSWNEIVQEKKYIATTELKLDIAAFSLSAYSTVASFVNSNEYAWRVPSVIVFVLVNLFRLSLRQSIYSKLANNEDHVGIKVLARVVKHLYIICWVYSLLFVYFLLNVHFRGIDELLSTPQGWGFLGGCICVFILGVLDKITWFFLRPEEV